MASHDTPTNRGFSLLEVLAALIVVSIGLSAIVELAARDGKLLLKEDIRCRTLLIGQSLCAYVQTGKFPAGSDEYGKVPIEIGIGECPGFTWKIVGGNEGAPALIRVSHPMQNSMDFPLPYRNPML